MYKHAIGFLEVHSCAGHARRLLVRIGSGKFCLLTILATLALTGISHGQDLAFFEKKCQTKITGVKPIGEYSDPDEYYSAIAQQLGIPKIAFEAAARKYGWKSDDGKIGKAILKRAESAGRWQIMIFRFSINKDTKKPDLAASEQKIVEIDDEGGVHFSEPSKEDEASNRSGGQGNPKQIGQAKEHEFHPAGSPTAANATRAAREHYQSFVEGKFKKMEKSFGHRPPLLAADQADLLFEHLAFKVLETQIGDYATDPFKPVETPDGKLHFNIEKGDVLFKAGPKEPRKGAWFSLFQLRQMEGNWRVVAEYLR